MTYGIAAWAGLSWLERAGGARCVDNAAPTIVIHDSIGSFETTRDASCGTSPANRAERKIHRQGLDQAKPAPTSAATSISAAGLRCAMGLKIAREAPLATSPTGRSGCDDHHDPTDSTTA